MTKVKLSVVLATFNEEEFLPECLASIKDLADEVIVIDGSSTDKTAQIAKKAGAQVFIEPNRPMFHTNKNIGIDRASGKWILLLDADERIPKKLSREIRAVVNSNPPENAYWIKRKNFFLGRYLKKGGQYPDPVIRLFRRGKARLPEKSVHEQMEVEGKTGRLENEILHQATEKFSRYLLRFNRYTSLEAFDLKRKNFSINPATIIIYIIVVPIRTFLSLFFRHQGFRDGFPGFVFALFSGFHHSVSFIKYWDLKRRGVTDLAAEWS